MADDEKTTTSTEVEVVQPIPVQVFEGALVIEHEGKVPAITLALDGGYARGTHLRLNIELRVKSIRYEENKDGDMVRQHVFALESAQLVSAFSPADAVDSVGGSAAGQTVPTEEDSEELGVEFGRTADTWDGEELEVQ